ncbi:MAG: RnfABCDGE type electron transport complex subunit B [Tannerella sp.]|jgi:Na+-translocating ferredoxin:NAD+ oxidoreductase RNF subunit RnfB|nr:RnfABCDGE type electron transport complex subunit B [Tannerella sp.]
MILYSVLSLGTVGALEAVILYFVSRKFKVEENPLTDRIQEALPGANCGGCGYPGCGGFAEACAKAGSLEGLNCPVGGRETMDRVATMLGVEAGSGAVKTAVVRCSGTCEARPRLNVYDGAKNCAIVAALYGGETGCPYGCFGYGDCVRSCQFGAIRINPLTQIAEVDEGKCTSCGACVKACPKRIIELRRKGPRSRRIYVSCVNRDKGGIARKACASACTGCTACQKKCEFGAIAISNSLAYIDDTKCRLCRKCASTCPTRAIRELNFPPGKEKEETIHT